MKKCQGCSEVYDDSVDGSCPKCGDIITPIIKKLKDEVVATKLPKKLKHGK